MIKRCVLCDGKIINKRCSECGMDYSRWEEHYHLNEEGCLECKRKTGTPAKISEEEKLRREKAVRDARSKRMNAQANKKTRVEYGASKPKKKGRKIVLAISLVVLVVDLLGVLFGNLSYGTREIEPESSVPVEIVPEYEAEDYDPYAYAVDEMPKEGERFAVELRKGSYYGAQQLPIGTYTVTLINDDGYGNVGLYDDRNMIYYFEYLDYADVTELTDVRIYEGTQIEIEGNIRVLLVSENAQITDMKKTANNPLLWSVEVTESMTAGEDFEPGIYDVYVTSGYGTLTRTLAGETYYDWYTWLNIESPEETVYYNKEFLAGDVIAFDEYSSDDFAVELIPSAAVYP